VIYTLPLLVACDHAGFELKQLLKTHRPRILWRDIGPFNKDQTDYPHWAKKLCSHIQGEAFGVLICGTGQGMCMTANKHPHIRASLCWNVKIAQLARSHNNSNVLCLGGRVLSLKDALEILDTFLKTPFANNSVYQTRVQNIK